MSDLKVNDRAKLKPIEKLYFNTYSYRVQISLGTDGINLDQRQRMRRTEVAAAVAAARISTMDWNYRLQMRSGSFYFTTHDDAVAFARAVSERVIEVNAPSSCFPYDLLSGDHNLRYRENLWFYKFRYQLYLRTVTEEQSTKIYNWLDETFDYNPGDTNDRIHASFGERIVIYLSDYDDVLLMKLYLSEHLKEINRIVLRNEQNQ